ncbi:PadR family transcriptional regulator [Streptococcus phocae subsp. salmonis]|uniref:PadR family transcriptional regulator n=1 Tax=Streptococcus phocae TaxID=119224 RepID=A0A0P6SL55_9STRE|nr:PadR family transcriptional regulator [Streptococcus phocae]KGR72127.1 PadR family transcriptional regulator [Streptococcus phocae subsp. salmonis]KPJ22240.1 PadR family transcriptional regulator [Streptococcus phocae]
MQEKILRKLYLGFIQIHILYHAKQEPFYGAWMIEELGEHGYDIGPGTLYPLLHSMESSKLLDSTEKTVEGRVRKYYAITTIGIDVLAKAKKQAYELFKEIED